MLGVREGSTENATLCSELFASLVERGFPQDRHLLFVIDGGKGLRKGIRDVFGDMAEVQRCQVHKQRNVLDHLPDEKRPQVRSVLASLPSPDVRHRLRQLGWTIEQCIAYSETISSTFGSSNTWWRTGDGSSSASAVQ